MKTKFRVSKLEGRVCRESNFLRKVVGNRLLR